MKQSVLRIFASLLVCVILFPTFVMVNRVSAERPQCECLEYYQWKTGLPATGNAWFAAADYPQFLENYKVDGRTKYHVVKTSPSTSKPSRLNGLMMVWAKNQVGAGWAGHIALVRSAKYDSRKKEWTIEFIDAKGWTSNSIKLKKANPEFGCSNVAVRELKTKSLDGISFYKVSNR